MMATGLASSSSGFLPLLESLEDVAAGQPEQTDVYLTIASRLSGEEGWQFLPAVEKHFIRLGKAILTHIAGSNPELSQAALQALGFCVYHANVVASLPENFAAEILSALCSLVVNSTDKNSCTRSLWVISKQSFPSEVVAQRVDSILDMLEQVLSRQDIQSVVMEHEALNVVIRLLEQGPVQMGVGAVRWSRLVIPMVVHSAPKVRLRAAAALELGLPQLLERQMEVAAVIEPLMFTKLVPELQKLFSTKNEVNVLKLWPLFVKLLGKHLHRGGPFINSLLHLEELGFRSSSPGVKKIAFIAWKSLIDNFALNPEILCSTKRMKLLLQPLLSIHVRTEALQLSRLEVWWYLVVRLGPNLAANFEQVSIPLLQNTIGVDSSSSSSSSSASSSSTLQVGTPVRGGGQNSTLCSSTPKTGTSSAFSSPATTPRTFLNSSAQGGQTFPPIQLLGLEMLLHYFLGPEVVATAATSKLQLTLEPLTHPFLSGGSTFAKHAALLLSHVTQGFIVVGADAPDSLLTAVWRSLVSLVSATVEFGSISKKERQGHEVLTLTLQALQAIVSSEALAASRVLLLIEITVKGIPPSVLGSASYQVGKMNVLNGTPALFLILLLYNSSMLPAYAEHERFFQCLNSLVGCGLGGPTSPLAFGEAVLAAVDRRASSVANKEHVWRMWSAVVTPLTDAITQSNEVNQGDALEHNFSAVHSSLMFPLTHLLLGTTPLPQMTRKSLLLTWSKLYKVFARCSALVPTAEENICCEELCARMAAVVNAEALTVPSALDAVSNILQVMVDCVDFSPYTPQFQQKTKSPLTPLWNRKKSRTLGNLSAFQALLVQVLEAFLAAEGPSDATGPALVSILSMLFTSLAQATPLQAALVSLAPALGLLYRRATSETPGFSSQLVTKLEKLLVELLGCLQTRSTLAYDDQLLSSLAPLLCAAFPHRNKALRKQATLFWNATFAKSSSLIYPEELKPVLRQVRQKTPIILPGFEAVTVSDEHSGQYSSESSQLETKLSGVQVSSVGKRASLLGRAAELKDQSPRTPSKTPSKPVSQTKLDFGSPKPPSRAVLEEEASIDFVFIPPENKEERVLTEHQKEVKRTKRADIPAMYNNLDASLDTTAFTQYTQSQDDATEKLSTEPTIAEKESPNKVGEMEVEDESDILSKDTQDDGNPEAAVNNEPANNEPANVDQEVVILESADAAATEDPEHKEADISGSSDLVSGTPQKPNSRRQSFITLEKYEEGKPASHIQVTKFTGPLARAARGKASPTPVATSSPSGNERKKSKTYHPAESTSLPERDDKKSNKSEAKASKRPSSGGTEDEDDVIPDTQTTAGNESAIGIAQPKEELDGASQEVDESSPDDEGSDGSLQAYSSQNSQGTPDDACRRSRRQRVRPRLPGKCPEDWEEKYSNMRKKCPEEYEGSSTSLNTSQADDKASQRRSGRQGRLATVKENHSEEKVRRSTRKDKNELPQTGMQVRRSRKVKLYSLCDDLLNTDEKPRRRSPRGVDLSQTDLQTDTQCDTDSQSQGRRTMRRMAAATETEKPAKLKRKGRRSAVEKQEEPQTIVSQKLPHSQNESQSQETADTKTTVLSYSEEFEPEDQAETDEAEASQSAPEAEASQSAPEAEASQSAPEAEASQSAPEAEASQSAPEAEASQSAPEDEASQSAPEAEASQSAPEAEAPLSAPEAEAPLSAPEAEAALSAPEAEAPLSAPEAEASLSAAEVSLSAPAAEASPAEASLSAPEAEASLSAPAAEASPAEASLSAPEAEPPAQSSQADHQSQGRRSRSSAVVSDPQAKMVKRSDGTAYSISQEISPELISSSSDTQLQSRLRRKSKSLESADNNSAETERNAESQTSPSVSRLRTRKRKVAEEEHSQNSSPTLDASPSKEDQLSKGQTRFSRRRSSQGLLDNKETSESDSSEIRQSSIRKRRYRKLVSPLVPSPLTAQNATMDIASETATVDSSSETSQGTLTTSPVKTTTPVVQVETLKDTVISLTMEPLLSSNVTQQCEVDANMEVEVTPIVDLEPLPENVGTKETKHFAPANTEGKCKQFPISPSKIDGKQRSSQSKLDPSEQGSLNYEITDTNTEHSQEGFLPPAPSVPPALSMPTAPANTSSNNVFTETIDLSSSQADDGSTQMSSGEAATNLSLQVSDSSEEKAQHVAQLAEKEVVAEEPPADSSEPSGVRAEGKGGVDASITPSKRDKVESQNSLDEPLVEEEGQVASLEIQAESAKAETIVQEEVGAAQAIPSAQEVEEVGEDKDTQIDKVEGETPAPPPGDSLAGCHAAMLPSDLAKEDYQASPAKHRSTEVLAGQEMALSPSGRTRGTWSPSASPSTSILKTAQKRPGEEDTVSPLVKSRRVSFANPIQHQEQADDIDRRSNVIRTSSPKRVKTNIGIPQPKYVTTPTKGLLVLYPRILHSPTIQGHKSSKKCLIPKMSQEPRAIPKDCVYPSLVFCSAPVEAVLPQIASNIWPRGFCQLVRARNIKTVGDLCSLTPSDIKTLPILPPKCANVKKALELYEQLRKIRSGGGALDQLKGFEEVEKMMGSGPEEANTSLNQEEDDKSFNEALATELLDESADQPPEQEGSYTETATQAEEEKDNDNNDEEEEEEEEEEGRPIAELTPGGQLAPGGLLSQVDALSCRATAGELGLCTAQQLVQLHDSLGGVMRSVMLELQGRLFHASGKH